VFFIEVWDYMLQRYALLYTADHLPLFFGPGFVEMRIILPVSKVMLCIQPIYLQSTTQ
jgi:uncharacterized protein